MAKKSAQVLAVGVEVGDGQSGRVGHGGRLCHGRGHFGQQARVHGLGQYVLAAEAKVLAAVCSAY